ncbi:LacX [Streptococcus pneumoniae]|nr:LacX [Streptococcus pneumoniae]CKH24453.1 LacX [Streptococcus pneumoniae]CKH24923.1 LacX [Streptococcus pneumoniae]
MSITGLLIKWYADNNGVSQGVSLFIATAAIVLVGVLKIINSDLMKPTFDDLLNAPSSSPMTSTHMNYMMNPVIMVLDKIFEKFFPGLDKYDFDAAKLNKKIGFWDSKFFIGFILGIVIGIMGTPHPICGSLREDTALYIDEKGQESKGKIPRHGLVRKKEFELVEQTDKSVTFAIEDDENSYQNYPYHFRLEITYSLTGKTVRTQYKIFNKETSKVMPYFIGGHPGFNCPLLDDEVYEDYYLEFEKEETCSVPRPFPETGMLDFQDRSPWLEGQKEIDLSYDLFSTDAVTLDELQSRTIALRSRKHDKGVKVHFAEFPNLIIWSTLNKGPFIAFEPWSGLSTSLEEGDHLEDKKNVRLLEANQVEEIGFEIEVL